MQMANGTRDIGRPARDSTNTTKHNVSEEMDTSDTESDEQTLLEGAVIDEVQIWLATHGKSLFALECSKFLASERKRQNLRQFSRK